MKVVYHLFLFFSFLRWSFLSSGLPSSFRPFEGTRTEIDNLTEPRPSPPSVVEPDVRCEPYYDLADTIHLSGALRARSGPIAWTGGLALVIRTCGSDLPARSGTGGFPDGVPRVGLESCGLCKVLFRIYNQLCLDFGF